MADLQHLADLMAQGASEEDVARALLEMTLDAASPDVADAARTCALPAWFNTELLAYLLEVDEVEAKRLLEQIAAFSFVQSREDGGYVYHEATRARMLNFWLTSERQEHFVILVERLARYYLVLAEKHVPRLEGPEYADALPLIDTAYPNIKASQAHVSATEQWELIRNFAYALADYHNHRGLWQDWMTWTAAGIKACQQLKDNTGIASMQNNLGNVLLQLPNGDRNENLKSAIGYFKQALEHHTPELDQLQYAATQNNLGSAYLKLTEGDRIANLKLAIACFEKALHFWEYKTNPAKYAIAQNNMGVAYNDLVTEDREEILNKAMECFKNALFYWTKEDHLLDYAKAMYNLGNTHRYFRSNRREHLSHAITCYKEALRYWTPKSAPLKYAMAKNNLGEAYRESPPDNLATNIPDAIACYKEALQFRRPETSPTEYATTLNGLGLAYCQLPTGDRTTNLNEAINCFNEALNFRTREGFPLQYISTQNNLGIAFFSLPEGDRSKNIRQAIHCFRSALMVIRTRIPKLFECVASGIPFSQALEIAGIQKQKLSEYVKLQNNLGNAWSQLPTGNRVENLKRATKCYKEVIEICGAKNTSLESAKAYNGLGTVHQRWPDDEDRIPNLMKSMANYSLALYGRTKQRVPIQFGETQYNLGQVFYELGFLDRAKEAFEQALEVSPAMGNRHMALGSVLIKLNNVSEATRYLNRARELLPEQEYYNWASLENLCGNLDAALDHLEKAIAWDATLRDWAPRDPDLESLRDDPRFQALVNEVDSSQ